MRDKPNKLKHAPQAESKIKFFCLLSRQKKRRNLKPHFQEKGMTKAKYDSWSHTSLKPQLFWNVDRSREVPLLKSHQPSLQCVYITPVPFASLSENMKYMVDFWICAHFGYSEKTPGSCGLVCVLKMRCQSHFITFYLDPSSSSISTWTLFKLITTCETGYLQLLSVVFCALLVLQVIVLRSVRRAVQ